MSTVRLIVTKMNKRSVNDRPQVFVCEEMGEVLDLTAGGSQFVYPAGAGKKVIPKLYVVAQTTSQVWAMCRKCCASVSG